MEAFARCSLVILPVVDYCFNSTVDGLSSWISSPGISSKRIFAITSGTSGPIACSADEYANTRDPSSLVFLSGASSSKLVEALELLHENIEPAFVKAAAPRLFKCVESNTSGLIAFGIICKWAVEESGGSALLFVQNTTPQPFQLSLLWDKSLGAMDVDAGVDVLTGLVIPIGSSGTTLPSEGTLFLRIAMPKNNTLILS